MSQPKWWVKETVIALFILAGTAGIICALKFKDASNSHGISLGEEILIEKNIPIKQELEKAFVDRDYQQSKNLLGDYLKQNENRNSPELWVYWNNATAALLSKNPIKIAVSIPIGTNQDVAEEILAGVALAQHEFNERKNGTGINGELLQVVIANDNNDSKLAEEVAKNFVQDSSILGVVGHNASNATLAAMEVYENKLVMITPTSFSDKIQGYPYIFRMIPQISYFANKLAGYIKQENPNSIVGICMDPSSVDNESFIAQFKAVFPNKTIELPCDFLEKGLTSASFNEEVTSVLDEIKQKKINSFVSAPYISRLPEMSKIFQAIHSTNSSTRLYGSPTLFTHSTLQAGQAVEGLTLSVPWYPNRNELKNVQFQQKFLQLYETHAENWRIAMSYDATWTIVTGLEKISEEKQPIEREQLNNVLNGITPYSTFIYNGVTGKTTFSSGGVNENQSDILIQIKNKQFTPLRP